MKLLNRFLVLIIALIFMFCCLVVSLYSFGITEVEFLPELLASVYNRWDVGIILLIAFIAGASIIYPFFKISNLGDTTNINQTELGSVNITLSALDNLIKKVARGQEGIKDISTNLKNTENGILVHLTAKVKPDMNIPNTADNLQKMIKNYLEDTSGVTVNEVEILIKEIDDKSDIDRG